MFDIMRVAKTIKEARIARDMTQMNLADAMEVIRPFPIGREEILCRILPSWNSYARFYRSVSTSFWEWRMRQRQSAGLCRRMRPRSPGSP